MHRSRSDLEALLAGKWVAVLGDSVARLFYAALLRAAGASPDQHVVEGHQSFDHTLLRGARSSFVWAPFSANLTESLTAWAAAAASVPRKLGEADPDAARAAGVPDVLVLCASLWHMLHVGDPDAYALALQQARTQAQSWRL